MSGFLNKIVFLNILNIYYQLSFGFFGRFPRRQSKPKENDLAAGRQTGLSKKRKRVIDPAAPNAWLHEELAERRKRQAKRSGIKGMSVPSSIKGIKGGPDATTASSEPSGSSDESSCSDSEGASAAAALEGELDLDEFEKEKEYAKGMDISDFFHIHPLGGGWTKTHTDESWDRYLFEVYEGAGRIFCEIYDWPSYKSYTKWTYGVRQVRLMCQELLSKSDYFFGLWVDSNFQHDFKFLPGCADGYQHSDEFLEECFSMPKQAFHEPMMWIYNLVPSEEPSWWKWEKYKADREVKKLLKKYG